MSKKNVLIITQEMHPYTALNEISNIARKLPQYVKEKGMEIRVLMPRFGLINERRHRLHEVVRLSGMNIIVDDDDFPLIIKVASLPEARIQVYFLDNEDFFKRKAMFAERDEDGNEGARFEDNPDRMVFFCKGVIETVKKFGWPPDIIHCNGWMTSLIPLYLRTAYKTEPLFRNAKIVYSLYEGSLGSEFSDAFVAKASINDLTEEDLGAYQNGQGVTLDKGAVAFADAFVVGSQNVDAGVMKAVKASGKPVLSYQDPEAFAPAYVEFYNTLVEAEVENEE